MRSSLILFFLLLTLAGCSSSSSYKNISMDIKDNAIEELESLKNLVKFGAETSTGYIGLLPQEMQPEANDLMNKSINHLIRILKKSPTKDNILNEFKRGLSDFDAFELDTEDRERVCEYYDQIREIIGFDSTDGILNDWLY